MDSISNPYTPNAGAAPEIIIGGDDQLEAFTVLLRELKASSDRAVDDHHRGCEASARPSCRPVRDIQNKANWEVVQCGRANTDNYHHQAMFRSSATVVLVTRTTQICTR